MSCINVPRRLSGLRSLTFGGSLLRFSQCHVLPFSGQRPLSMKGRRLPLLRAIETLDPSRLKPSDFVDLTGKGGCSVNILGLTELWDAPKARTKLQYE